MGTLFHVFDITQQYKLTLSLHLPLGLLSGSDVLFVAVLQLDSCVLNFVTYSGGLTLARVTLQRKFFHTMENKPSVGVFHN